MKRFISSAVTMIAILALAGAASAGNTVQLGAGLGFPTGDLDDGWNMGLAFDGTILFEMAPTFSLGLNAGYHHFGIDTDLLDQMVGVSGVEWDGGGFNVFNACGELRVHTGAMDATRFWGSLGAGLYNLSLSDLTGTYQGQSATLWANVDSESKFGGYLGAGFALPMGPSTALGLEAKYHTVFEDFADAADTYKIHFFDVKAAVVLSM